MTSNTAKPEDWNAHGYIKNASFVPRLTEDIIKLLDIKPEDRILDLGCGDGFLTANIVKKCQRVIGVDYSKDMIDRAIDSYKRDHTNLDFLILDGQDLDKEDHPVVKSLQNENINKVFSNAALHWMKRDPQQVVNGVAKLLRGSSANTKSKFFVGEMGGFMNVGEIRMALTTVLSSQFGMSLNHISSLDPWFFPSAEQYQSILQQAGFKVEYIELVPRPTPLTTDIIGWLETFAISFVRDLSQEDRKKAFTMVADILREGYQREDGKWFVMYVRLRFKATI